MGQLQKNAVALRFLFPMLLKKSIEYDTIYMYKIKIGVISVKHENSIVSDINIAYIGGGSRGWAWTLMNDLAKDEEIGGDVRLYDIDLEGAKINEKIGNALSAREDVKGKWTYKAYETIGEALTGADFVVISVLPGTFDEMESDVHTPEKYGNVIIPMAIIRRFDCILASKNKDIAKIFTFIFYHIFMLIAINIVLFIET